MVVIRGLPGRLSDDFTGKSDAMWEPLRQTIRRLSGQAPTPGPVRRWALSRGLTYEPLPHNGFVIAGRSRGQAWRVQAGEPGRDYIEGAELAARLEPALPSTSTVVLLNRALKRRLQAESTAWFSRLTDPVETMAQQVPEAYHWLSAFRDVGWAGPSAEFWRRYAVLTDQPELAKRWLDDSTQERLLAWPLGGVTEDTPLVIQAQRGKLGLRLQLDPLPHPDTVVHALETLRHLAERTAALRGGMDDPVEGAGSFKTPG